MESLEMDQILFHQLFFDLGHISLFLQIHHADLATMISYEGYEGMVSIIFSLYFICPFSNLCFNIQNIYDGFWWFGSNSRYPTKPRLKWFFARRHF